MTGLKDTNRRTLLKTIWAGAVGGTALIGSATANHGKATARLRPINSDADGREISGEVMIEDIGSELNVTGTASNLAPDTSDRYLSLFYDIASSPNGPGACEPAVHDPDDHRFLTFSEMLAAAWNVDGDGDGTAVDTSSDDPELREIGTISIRDTHINRGRGPDAVVACGEVTHRA